MSATNDDGSEVVAICRQLGIAGFDRLEDERESKAPAPPLQQSNDNRDPDDGSDVVAFCRQLGIAGFAEPDPHAGGAADETSQGGDPLAIALRVLPGFKGELALSSGALPVASSPPAIKAGTASDTAPGVASPVAGRLSSQEYLQICIRDDAAREALANFEARHGAIAADRGGAPVWFGRRTEGVETRAFALPPGGRYAVMQLLKSPGTLCDCPGLTIELAQIDVAQFDYAGPGSAALPGVQRRNPAPPQLTAEAFELLKKAAAQ